MKFNMKRRSAFSLIELSIVLIIIGLLIAGVTGGASLIKSSELRSVITESRSWSVAVNSFYNQFDDLPGDYASTIGSQSGGDGDGTIEYDSGDASDVTDHEGRNAWRHLAATNILDTSVIYSGTSTATLASAADPANALSTFGTYIPSSKIGSAGWDFDYNSTSTHNVVVLTGSVAAIASGNTLVNAVSSEITATGAITPTDGLSLDSKYDDAVANAGSIRAVEPNGNTCFTTTAYDTTTTTKDCALSFRVDVNT